MKYRVLCPDGKDRLLVRHDTLDEALFDASYFSGRSTCLDWTPSGGDKGCPGGVHTVPPDPPESEPLIAWAV